MQRKRTTLPAPARGGFTLIELLIVMAIITILLSITAAAVFKGFAVIYRANTMQTLGKIDKRLDRRMADMRRDADSWDTGTLQAFFGSGTFFPAVGFSQRQLKVIQLKLLKKWSFPMYYQDAAHNLWLSKQLYSPNGYGFAAGLYARLIQRVGFADTTGSGTPPTTPPNPSGNQRTFENSGCLATVFEHLGSLDELASNELVDGNQDGILEIVDGWGTPLMYDRFPLTTQNYDAVKFAFLSNFELTRAKLAFPAKFPPAPNSDPDDPEGLLVGLSSAQWQALDFVFNNFGTSGAPFLTTFSSQNAPDGVPYYPRYLPLVIYSAGPDRTFGQLDSSSPSTPFGLDDLDSYSWRVTVQGQ
jgi:prepilin-type N-terminal cleavage/methylation domain-containing protein